MNISPSPITGTPCDLRLIPVERILRFAVVSSLAHFTATGTPIAIPGIVPGTIVASDQSGGGVHAVAVGFKVRGGSSSTSALLETLSRGRFIALYLDERRVLRVSGSPSHPLVLTHAGDGSFIDCQLSGKGLHCDAYARAVGSFTLH